MNADKVRKFREKYNLTQDKLAELVNRKRRVVQIWEDATEREMPDNLFMLAEMLLKKKVKK